MEKVKVIASSVAANSSALSRISSQDTSSPSVNSAAWTNSDRIILPTARITQIKNAPVAANVPPSIVPRHSRPLKTRPANKVLAALGILSASVGVTAGMLSIIAIGPGGLVIAAAAALFGWWAIKAGTAPVAVR